MYFAVEQADSVDVCNQLSSEILASDELNWMALVDGAFDLNTKKIPEWPSKEILFEYAGFRDVLYASPYLIHLETNDAVVLKRQLWTLVEHRKNRPMLSFLSSRYSAVNICLRWKDFVNVHTEDNHDFILRFADTRVIEVLPACLSPSTWLGLSNLLESWLYINRSGKLDFVPTSKSEYLINQKAEITSVEFSNLVEACEPDAIVDILFRNQSELLEKYSPGSLYKRVKAVSEFARRNSIIYFPDVVALSTFDLVSETPIAENAILYAMIESKKWAPGNLIDSLVDLVDEDI